MLKVLKIAGSIVASIGSLWLAFEIYDGWRDKKAQDDTFQARMMQYVVTDSIKSDHMIDRQDSVITALADYQETVDILAKKHVEEIRNDPSLTRDDFLYEMEGLMEYLEDVKKNDKSIAALESIPLTDSFLYRSPLMLTQIPSTIIENPE